MKVKKLVAILCGIMLIALGVGFLSLKHYGFAYGRSNNISFNFNFPFKDLVEHFNDSSTDYIEKNIDEEIIEEAAGISTIDIDVDFSNINIIPEDRDDIRVHFHGYVKANFIPSIKTRSSNGSLYISFEKDSKVSNNTQTVDVNLDIYVPKTYDKAIKIDTSFGNIDISSMTLSQLKLFTSFGNIYVKDLAGDLEASTSFGNIDLEYKEFDYNIDANTSFGDIRLTLPKNSQFKIDAECSFGNINIDFPVKVTKNEKDKISGNVGNSSNTIELESSSGDIEVIRK